MGEYDQCLRFIKLVTGVDGDEGMNHTDGAPDAEASEDLPNLGLIKSADSFDKDLSPARG